MFVEFAKAVIEAGRSAIGATGTVSEAVHTAADGGAAKRASSGYAMPPDNVRHPLNHLKHLGLYGETPKKNESTA